jgi:hypothetical protein
MSRKAPQKKEVLYMTKREMFTAIANVAEVAANQEMVDFLNHEIELLNRKASSSRKPTKTQVENESFKALIVEYLESADTPKSIKELQAEIPEISELTNQRVTHMLTDLVKAETLTKEYVKKTPYYSIAA